MLKQCRFLALALVACVTCLSVPGLMGSSSTVMGRVVTADGSAVPRASVEAVRLPDEDEQLSITQSHWTPVDQDGKFQLTLSPGRYEIRAKAESDGYPDPNFMLSIDPLSDFPVVTANGGNLLNITVKLGTQGGILDGELIDQSTHQPVEKGKVTIADAKNPKIFVEAFTNKLGQYEFAVPNKALRISGSAPGYQSTHFEGNVTLVGGEHRYIRLELPPE